MPKATEKVKEEARRLVRARDGHRCQKCGASVLNIPSSIHHRRRRGMGGSALLERPSNLVRLCGDGVRGCHGQVESHRAEAKTTGWLLGYLDNPETTPLLTYQGLVLLTDDGGRIELTTEGQAGA